MTDQILTRNCQLSITERADSSKEGGGNLVLSFPFSSETPYLRDSFFDEPWVEILGHEKSEVDLSRLQDGAPVLLNHGRSATDETSLLSIGITQKAWVDGNRGQVEIKLSRRDDMKSVLQDIQDGIVRNVSVGYQIKERVLTKENEGSPDEYRVTSWLPMEITLCDVPADATVGIGRSLNKEDEQVSKEKIAPVEDKEIKAAPVIDADRTIEPVKAAPKVDTGKLQDDAIKAERKRSSDIKTLVRSVSLDDDLSDSMIERGVTLEEARAEVLTKLAERTSEQDVSSRADIHVAVDETDTRREYMTDAILHRANPAHDLTEGARQFAGLSMLELSRENLRVRGVDTKGMDRMQIAGRAFEGTSDLPNVLANVANKSLRTAYESAPRTFTGWARQASASDFKAVSRTNLSDAPALEAVTENGEFKRGSVTDGKETYQLATVGKIIGLTRQAIINDDLSAFTRIPALFAAAAANYESDTVYSILTANAALSDTVALFHTSHGNLTGTGTVISVASLGIGRKLMRKQKTPKLAVMNLRPKYLIVPVALETVAAQFVSSAYVADQSSTINPFAGALEVIPEARLDDTSETAWYLAADNSAIDTVEYCYLEGNSGVYIETRQGFDVDGMEIKARLDFAAKAIDHRGVYKNNGA